MTEQRTSCKDQLQHSLMRRLRLRASLQNKSLCQLCCIHVNQEVTNKGIRCKQVCVRSLWRRSKQREPGNQCLGDRGNQIALRATPQHAYQRWLDTSSSVARPTLQSVLQQLWRQRWIGSTARQSHQCKPIRRNNDATHKMQRLCRTCSGRRPSSADHTATAALIVQVRTSNRLCSAGISKAPSSVPESC